MRRFLHGKKIILGFGLALLLLLLLSVVAYRNILVLMETSREVAHLGEVLATLENLLSQAREAEVKQGYLLTGDELFLAPYHAARQTLLPTLQHLRHLTNDNLQHRVRLVTLEALIKERLALTQSMIDRRKAKGPKTVIPPAHSERGKELMTEISSLVDGLRSEEVALLQQRRATTDRTAQTVLRVIVVSDVLAVVFVVFASGAMQQTLTRRKAAERALLQAYAHMEPWEQGGPTALSQPNSEWRHESFERQLAEGPPHVQPNAHDNPKH